MKRMMCGLMVGLLGTACAEGRTVSLSSFDRDTGVVSLAVTAGEDVAGEQALIAAWNPGDTGADATAWRETALVANVAAGADTIDYALPADWRARSGAVRFFLMTSTAPYAARLESITSTATGPGTGPWIDTGVVPDTNTAIEVRTYHPLDMAEFGVSSKFYFFSNAANQQDNRNGNYFCGFFGDNNGGAAFTAPRGTVPRTLRLDKTGAFVDGTCYVTFDPAKMTQTTTSTLTLMGRRTDGQTSVGKMGNCTLYWAKILQDGELTHDYVPCRTPGGVVTLYDRVAKSFCEVSCSGGTFTFTAGAEVGPLAADCGEVESTTDALLFAPSFSVTAKNAVTGEVTVQIDGAHDEGLLLVAGDTEDRGTTLADWSGKAFFAKVSADAETVTATLPQTWWNDGYTVRFFWKSAYDFPYDYEMESLHTAGSAYVNTGWIPTSQTDIEVCAKSPADVCHFGLTTHFYLFCNGGTTFYGYFGNSGSFAAYSPNVRFRTLRLGPSGAYLDDNQLVKEFTSFTAPPMKKATPIPFRRDFEKGDLSKTGECWVKAAKIRERDELVRDFVPCVSNGVAGLFDRVHAKFYGSAVSATFVIEPAAMPATEQGDVLAWAEAYPLASEANGVWDNGGADTLMTTVANWEEDALPELTDGTAVLTFASAGTKATVVGPTTVRGLKFNARNNFTLDAQGADSALSIGVGGITLENDPAETISDDWRLHTFACPVELTTDQTWNLSPNNKRRIQLTGEDCLRGASDTTVTVTGNGCLGFVATNSFKGDFRLEGGIYKVLSKCRPFGAADEGGKVYLDMQHVSIFDVFGAVIDKPLVITGGNTTSEAFMTHEQYGTNVFAAPVTLNNADLMVSVSGPTVFAGGCTFNSKVTFTGTHGMPLIFRGKPVTSTGGFEFWNRRDIHFEVPSNKVSLAFNGKYSNPSTVHCWVDYAFQDYTSALTLTNSITVNLHGHSQNFANVQILDKGSCVTSDEPADFFAFNNGDFNTTFKGPMEGKVNLVKSGAKTVTLGCANTSTGFLRAQNGPLVIGANGRWTGTEVYVGRADTNRKPSLRLTHDACFADPRNTKLTLTTSTGEIRTDFAPDADPVIEVDEGVRHVFGEAWLDGHRLAGGTWGSSQSSADHKDDKHFKGKGMIYVRGEGTLVIVR